MARTRVTSRSSTPHPQGAHLGWCVRVDDHSPDFSGAPLEACEVATEAQRALQNRFAAAAAALPPVAQPLAGLGALNREPYLLVLFFGTLAVDERARLALVHRSWAAFLARPELWQVLDCSPAGGLRRAAVCDRLLRGAAARACGALHTLDVSDSLWRLCIESQTDDDRPCNNDDDAELDDDVVLTDEALRQRRFDSTAALLSVLAANGASLRVLRAQCVHELCDAPAAAGLRPPQLLAALAAAPELTALHADVACTPAQVPALLRREGPYGPLRMRRLALCGQYREHERDDPAARPGGDDHHLDASLAALLSSHLSLCELELDRVHLGAPGDAAAAAEAAEALAACRNVRSLRVHGSDGVATEVGYARQAPALPADTTLAALLPPLRELALQLPLLDTGEAARLAARLRAAPLQALSLTWPGADRTAWPKTWWVPHEAPDAAAALAAGLEGHPTLRRLWLRDWPLAQPADGGAITAPALVAMLTAHAPALQTLHVSGGLVTGRDDFTDQAQEGANEEHAAAFLAALAEASAGAPALRHLSVPTAGLCALETAQARAAAPALRTLTLLFGDDRDVKGSNQKWITRGRGAARKWLPWRDLLNDPPPKMAASDEEEDGEKLQ